MKTFVGTLAASVLSAKAFAAAPDNPFSNYFSVGFGENAPFIREVTTTLVLPTINPRQKGFLKLYPELYTNASASLTGTAITLLDDRNPCPDNLYGWCIGARLVLGNAQNSGEYVPAPHDTKLAIKVSYDDATKKHLQQVSIDGKVVSSLPVTSEDNLVAGRGIGFRTQVECQLEACGAVSSHSYIDTRIVLDSADPSFGSTKDVLRTTGDLKTADGGLTWTIDEIVVMSYTYEI